MTMTDNRERLLPDHPDDDGLRVRELTDLLSAVYEALAIPLPATSGDGRRYDELLLERVMHVRLTLRRVLVEGASAAERSRRRRSPDVAWETAYLREQLDELAPSGYNTAPWPGIPVEEFLTHGQTGLDRCPRCGRQLVDGDPDGLEAIAGQRWCITHPPAGWRAGAPEPPDDGVTPENWLTGDDDVEVPYDVAETERRLGGQPGVRARDLRAGASRPRPRFVTREPNPSPLSKQGESDGH